MMKDHPTANLLRARPGAVELREDDDSESEQGTLHGHFAVFDQWTEIDSVFEGRFMERISPGAFEQTFEERSPRVLFDHGHDPSIGNKPIGTPDVLEEDEVGARYEVGLFDAGYVNDLRPAIRSGQLGASFRFSVTGEDWDKHPDESDINPEGIPERTITGVDLFEFGPVTFPAYDGATAGLRSRTDEWHSWLTEPQFVERMIDTYGPNVARRLLESTQIDTAKLDDGQQSPERSDAGSPTNQGRLLKAALTEIRRYR